MIRAEVHLDDHRRFANFDATLWFAQASDEEIQGLASVGWGGDVDGDGVAEFMSGLDKDVQYVLEHDHDCGFECHVSEADAARWLHANKPALFEKLEFEADILTSDVGSEPIYTP